MVGHSRVGIGPVGEGGHSPRYPDPPLVDSTGGDWVDDRHGQHCRLPPVAWRDPVGDLRVHPLRVGHNYGLSRWRLVPLRGRSTT